MPSPVQAPPGPLLGENQPENIPSEFVVSLDETGRKVPLIGKAEVARQLLEARVRTEAVPDGVEILSVVPGSAARPGEKHHPTLLSPTSFLYYSS